MKLRVKAVFDGLLLAVAGLAMTCAGWVGWQIWTATHSMPSSEAISGELVPLRSLTTVGLPDARVGVVEFSDFDCPFCARFATETHPSLTTAYVDTGKVMWTFSHLPLEALHPGAIRAASAAHCAALEGKFWPYYSALFSAPGARTGDDFRRLARELHIQRDPMECETPAVASEIRQQRDLAARHGLSSTPGFLLGKLDTDGNLLISRRISGFRSVHEFSLVLDGLLR